MFNNLKQTFGTWCIRKIQKYGPHRVSVLGKTYEISEAVFNPKYYYTSEFMARHINAAPEDMVLDMGTGSGIQAVTAAQRGGRVVAVDINPEAVKYAKKNVKFNGVEERVSVLQGDLFSPLSNDDRFDIILFTPPYLKGIARTNFDRALFDHNKTLALRFFEEAKRHLKENGYVQMVYSSIAEPEKILKISDELGWRHMIIARKKGVFEEFIIYKLTR
ncbi:MAG: tRNA (adenine(22)-N(1))-methyltransferase TrmK [Candidatus Aminicenantes bacterium]|nr:tRNA (adenine(22)-N(1))-methyltransferase TrmK [Candidatus Aminicenantes bacterium]